MRYRGVRNRVDLIDPRRKTIKRIEIGCALPRAVDDHQLMPATRGLCSDGARAASAQVICEYDERVNSGDAQIVHEADATTADIENKTAQHALLALKL